MKRTPPRRRFLRQALGVGAGGLLARGGIVTGLGALSSACGGGDGSTAATPPGGASLPIPRLDTGTLQNGIRLFELTMRRGSSELVTGVRTATMGYNDDLLGPVLRMRQGESVSLRVSNTIGETSTTHWHGMHLPASMDGGPHQTIADGATWTSSFDVRNEAATLWYHPHTHGRTGFQVYQGLAGMIIVDDGHADTLGLPSDYGIDDIPLIIQDRRLNADGSLAYLTRPMDRMGMKGDRILANGKEHPRLAVPAQWIRLRILNGSNARIYNLGLSDGRPFEQIASDGGLLTAPVTLNRLLLAPGERAEIMIDLSRDLGNELRLASYSSEVRSRLFATGGMGGGPADALDDGIFDILTIAVDRAATANAAHLPASLNGLSMPTPSAPDRLFTLEASQGVFTINGKAMDLARIDETITLGATEVWQITNNHGMAHPFHLHDVMFQILSRDGNPPPDNELGWKDTVLVTPGETVRLIATFSDYSDPNTPYMYHCHILEHEDNAMMGQFVVV